MTLHRPDLSVILPCYHAAPLARRSVAELDSALQDLGIDWEVFVVDDGSQDFLPDEWRDHPRVQLLRHAVNRGKGAAVRTGMLAATGHVRIFTDADLPFGTDLIPVKTPISVTAPSTSSSAIERSPNPAITTRPGGAATRRRPSSPPSWARS